MAPLEGVEGRGVVLRKVTLCRPMQAPPTTPFSAARFLCQNRHFFGHFTLRQVGKPLRFFLVVH